MSAIILLVPVLEWLVLEETVQYSSRFLPMGQDEVYFLRNGHKNCRRITRADWCSIYIQIRAEIANTNLTRAIKNKKFLRVYEFLYVVYLDFKSTYDVIN